MNSEHATCRRVLFANCLGQVSMSWLGFNQSYQNQVASSGSFLKKGL
jgi:hypothetical protein